MRIDANFGNLQPMAEAKLNRSNSVEVSSTPAGADEAKLSWRESGISKLNSAALDAPEIRTELVQSLRAAIQSGNYSVSHFAVAESMFNELF